MKKLPVFLFTFFVALQAYGATTLICKDATNPAYEKTITFDEKGVITPRSVESYVDSNIIEYVSVIDGTRFTTKIQRTSGRFIVHKDGFPGPLTYGTCELAKKKF